ncbi:MAG: hypothetical protein AAFR67_18335, partial [Chloroflexota bacterium]
MFDFFIVATAVIRNDCAGAGGDKFWDVVFNILFEEEEEAIPLPEMDDIISEQDVEDDIPEFVAASASTVIP